MGGISKAKVKPALGGSERSCDILYKKSSGGYRPGGVQEAWRPTNKGRVNDRCYQCRGS